MPARSLTGVPAAARAAVVAGLLPGLRGPVALAVCADGESAERLAAELPAYLDLADLAAAWTPHWLPEPGAVGGARHREAAAERLTVLEAIRAAGVGSTPRAIVAASVGALAWPVPDPAAVSDTRIHLRLNQQLSPRKLAERLAALDYDAEALCEAPGQYALRGGLVDIYPVTADRPYRIDFFGDTVEDIRAYDPVTQRSGERVEELVVTVAPSVALPAAGGGVADYLGPQASILVIEPLEVEAALPEAAVEAGVGGSRFFQKQFQERRQEGDLWYGLSEFESPSLLLPGAQEWPLSGLAALNDYRPDQGAATTLAESFWLKQREARRRFFDALEAWRGAGAALHFVFPREGEEKRAREILEEEAPALADAASFALGKLTEGVRLALDPAAWGEAVVLPGAEPAPGVARWPSLRGRTGIVVVTEAEFFGRRQAPRVVSRKRTRQVSSQVDQLLDFAELAEGDAVVHLQHGVGVYRGVGSVELSGEEREAIRVEFDEGVVLHVPLHESHLLTRYVGLSKQRPVLGKVGSGRWEKTRRAAERSALDLAAQLLETQAAREERSGAPHPPDGAWQREFEAAFSFPETPDQLKAIAAAKEDMERARPMDRLVCGDVGFGKTEVAIRAAFKAVMGGRQVAVLVPTTVLAQQHLNTFRERMAGFPVAVEMLNRFRSPKEQDQILRAAAEGRVDILIGTHRILSDDVSFRDLGLVVVDEEQRFGVVHKERLKRLRRAVDVLTLSATPIPRTLYLALTGARDLSVIETAPAERHPIQTFVRTFDLKLIEEAVRHEVKRGGQVFYLHNRVETIDSVAAKLQALLPDLSIAVGHGQMREHQLERVMTEFVAGRHQMLVCTTIIESGIDIANCNTILIEGADRFGLSQLYQIRGRVGRFRRQAYAYLLLHRHARLLDAARQRLAALRQHTQLGAGFRIAMRDLELRGAGNLLGPEQSGHIAGVGFDLYCQLLRQSVARLRGEAPARWVRCALRLDFVRFGASRPEGAEREVERGPSGYLALREEELEAGTIAAGEARLPAHYIPETRLRLDLYRQLAMADGPARVREIESELQDRFGPPPPEARLLLATTELRTRAEQKGIQLVQAEANRLKLQRASGRPDDFVMVGSRFPRLTERDPLSRLREILIFLNNLPDA